MDLDLSSNNEAQSRERDRNDSIRQEDHRLASTSVASFDTIQAEQYLRDEEDYYREAMAYWENILKYDEIPYHLTEEFLRAEKAVEEMELEEQEEKEFILQWQVKREKLFKIAYVLGGMTPLRALTKTKPAAEWNNVTELQIAPKTDRIGYTLLNFSDRKGVFLLARGFQPDASPYGDTMKCIPAEEIISSNMHLYYAGWYCFRKNGPHYVILMLSRQEIEDPTPSGGIMWSDNKMNIHNNDILVVKNGEIFVNHHFWVELFVTENVDVRNRITKSVRKLPRAAIGTGVNELCDFCNADEDRCLDYEVKQKEEMEIEKFIAEHEKNNVEFYSSIDEDYPESPDISPNVSCEEYQDIYEEF